MRATLNTASISNKLNAWAHSPAGQKAMSQKIDEYIDKDIRKTQAGGRVLTVQWVRELAQELCRMIESNAASLPDSVKANVASISPFRPQKGRGGAIKAEINFQSVWLSRESLEPERYGGIDNIIVLFEKGYTAKGQVFGEWHGEMVKSLTHRDGLGFIENAVSDFNARYASLGVVATVQGEYA